MANQGDKLKNFNNQLVKCIEDLREKREEVNRQIINNYEEKLKTEKSISLLNEKLEKLNESLIKKNHTRDEYDKAIKDTESAYMKILESSQNLLHVIKQESVTLKKKQEQNSK